MYIFPSFSSTKNVLEAFAHFGLIPNLYLATAMASAIPIYYA